MRTHTCAHTDPAVLAVLQVAMLCFMMWMSGNTLHLFSIMTTLSGIYQPLSGGCVMGQAVRWRWVGVWAGCEVGSIVTTLSGIYQPLSGGRLWWHGRGSGLVGTQHLQTVAAAGPGCQPV